MKNSQFVKKIIETNVTIGLLISALFVLSYKTFPTTITANISEFFLPTYLFLILGAAFYFLLQDINLKLASVMNSITLPFSGITFLFVRWLPSNLEIFQQPNCAGLLIATYTGLLILYYATSLHLHKKYIKK